MPQWKQFSGNWTVTQAAQAKGAGTWPEFPGAPTIGTATPALLSASVAFTAPANPGYPTTLSYTVTSSPGSITASGSASPITVSGLTAGTSYTFTVTATNP
jgi:large repetitive protein